ncbi:MAG TPA: hypothetical protein VF602_10940 [Pedobacter sp.]|jgi:hypothetical protein
MNISAIEITENEYLIKLNKESFDLEFINGLLKRIQTELLFSSFKSVDAEEDLISRNASFERSSYFSRLDEK